MPTHPRNTGSPIWLHSRRGSTYLAVMGVALIVSMLGMAAMTTARIENRRAQANHDLDHARCLAQNALEFALANLENDPAWRTTYTNNVESSPLDFTFISSEQGTMAFKLVDEEDGLLADDISDPVRVYGIGRVNEAEYFMSVLVEAKGAALDCLSSALHADDNLWINGWSDTISATGGPLSTNKQCKNWGTINGDVQCDGLTGTGTVNGTVTDPLDPDKTLPGPNVWDYYLTNGTWIKRSDLTANKIDKVVLSDTHNPYGSGVTNPEGIYVVDMENNNLVIEDARLKATLVVLNPGPSSKIEKGCHWEPAVPNFPALLVDGHFEFKFFGDLQLGEAATSVNFNPTHTPYNGSSDGDTSDTYPNIVKGLVYVAGNLTIQHQCELEGSTVIGGYLNMFADMNLTYDPIHLYNPPPGFHATNGVSSAEQQWIDQNTSNSGSGSNYTLGGGNGVGTYFAPPSLPAEATSWGITRVQIYANDAGSTGTFNANVTKSDGAQKPGVVLQSKLIQEIDLPGTFSWHEITFSNAGGLLPSEGACVVFVSGSNAGARLKSGIGSTGSPSTHRLVTSDSGGSWATESSNDLWIKIWGTYTTSSGSEVEISPGSWRREVSQ